jgi:hypothetical protein
MDIDQAFWAKCWSTFVHRFSLEPHILINSMCQGNQVVNLWVSSVMDNFWMHINFPIEEEEEAQTEQHQEDDTRSYASYDPYARRYRHDDHYYRRSRHGEDRYTQRYDNEDRYSSAPIEPLRIQMKSKGSDRERYREKKNKTPSSVASFDSNVSEE